MKPITGKPRCSFFLAGLATAVCLFFVSSCGEEKPTEVAPVVRPVKTMTIGAGESVSYHVYPGRVRAIQEADLSFEVSGRLIEFPVERGKLLAKGDLVGRLDQRDFESTLSKEKANYAEAKEKFEMSEKLYKQEVLSRAEYITVKKSYDVSAERLKIAEKALADTVLKASFSGYVARKFVENYQQVKAEEPIISLQDISELKIVISVPEHDVAQAPGDGSLEAVATFASIPGEEFKVKAKEFETEADPATQTFAATFSMKQPEDVNILPGMTAEIKIEERVLGGESASWYVVPADAVFADEAGRQCVWVVEQPAMTVHRREVKVGELTGSGIQVIKGLKDGEMIATSGVHHLREGMKVRSLESRKEGRQR